MFIISGKSANKVIGHKTPDIYNNILNTEFNSIWKSLTIVESVDVINDIANNKQKAAKIK